MLTSIFVHADPINTQGTWGDTGLRSSIPASPEASIEGDVLSIYFTGTLSNLAVTVVDEMGTVAYQGIISGESGSMVSIPLGIATGTYQLTLSHGYGTLSGIFNIE